MHIKYNRAVHVQLGTQEEEFCLQRARYIKRRKQISSIRTWKDVGRAAQRVAWVLNWADDLVDCVARSYNRSKGNIRS